VAGSDKKCMGFTLIELMIVIAIISILAAIAIPEFAKYRESSMDAAAKSALRNLAVAQENYYYFNNTYTANRGLLTSVNGWTVENNIIVSIKAADKSSWSATAWHISSSSSMIYSSSEGGLR
jgi:type IV pilus assembly protein PilA